MPDCETCAHKTDNSCMKSEVCAYCGNGFSYCDPVVDTDEGPMHRDCGRSCGW